MLVQKIIIDNLLIHFKILFLTFKQNTTSSLLSNLFRVVKRINHNDFELILTNFGLNGPSKKKFGLNGPKKL